MGFKKGQSGNPGGRSTEKPWKEALTRALKRRAETEKGNPQYLDVVADAVVEAAAKGDMVAAKEIGDRLDGKATQPIDHSGKVDTGLAEVMKAIDGRTRGLPTGR